MFASLRQRQQRHSPPLASDALTPTLLRAHSAWMSFISHLERISTLPSLTSTELNQLAVVFSTASHAVTHATAVGLLDAAARAKTDTERLLDEAVQGLVPSSPSHQKSQTAFTTADKPQLARYESVRQYYKEALEAEILAELLVARFP